MVGTTLAQKPFFYTDVNQDTHQLDTLSLKGVEDIGWNTFTINLGNHGSPELNLIPGVAEFSGNDYSLLGEQQRHQFKRYHLYRPVVDAKYVIGKGQEQHFNIYHSQNISKNVNYAVGLNKISSKGIYQNQSVNFTDIFFNIYGDELGKSKYNFEVQFNYKNASSSLNGGIANDSSFTNDTLELSNRELIEVNLLNAYQEKKLIYGGFKQGLLLWTNKDSLNKGTSLRLVNELEVQFNNRLFFDSILNEAYYDRIINDSDLTKDRLKHDFGKAYLGVNIAKNGKFTSKGNIGIEAAYHQYLQSSLDTNRLDIEAKANYEVAIHRFNWKIDGRYLINDAYTNKDYNIGSSLSFRFAENQQLCLDVYHAQERPQLDLLYYEGNHVSWSNSFQKYKIFHSSLEYTLKKSWLTKFKVNYLDIFDPIYFGYDKTPYQVNGVAQLIRTSLSTENLMSKRWELRGEAHYQYQGGYNVFRLPTFLASITAAVKFKAFKRKMNLSFGTKVTYFNPYETKSFDPVSGQFYIYSNQELGGYPYADVFIKGRVQRATFFFMVSNPHEGLLGYNYFYFPSYPANDRFFRLGVSWLFMN